MNVVLFFHLYQNIFLYQYRSKQFKECKDESVWIYIGWDIITFFFVYWWATFLYQTLYCTRDGSNKILYPSGCVYLTFYVDIEWVHQVNWLSTPLLYLLTYSQNINSYAELPTVLDTCTLRYYHKGNTV
jgi:hypothetical protein